MRLSNYSRCYSPLFRLALPVIFSQAGQMLVTLVDTLMVGSLNDENLLAAVAFSGNLSTVVMFMGLGISLAITPIVGRKYGALRHSSISFWLKQQRLLMLLIGLAQTVIMLILWKFIPYMQQPDAVVDIAEKYFLIIILSMLPTQIFAGNRQFAEGLANTRIAMLITLTGNMLNVVCNYLFIFGKFGCPCFGVYGAAIGTVISKVAMAVAMEMVIRHHHQFSNYSNATSAHSYSPRAMLKLFKVGLPIGGQMTIECLSFAVGGIMMGAIGAIESAAHQIVMTFTSLTYLMASGVASATTIKVSIFSGQNDNSAVKRYSIAAIQMVLVFMTSTAITYILLRHFIPSLIIDLQTVVEVAALLMFVGGLFQIFDGLQVVCLGILRGLGDMVYPAIVSGLAYALTCIPVGYLLAFTFGVGATGIWYGYLIGLLLASALLLIRIRYKFKQMNG